MRIGLFIPCYIDAFFPEVGIATLELLVEPGPLSRSVDLIAILSLARRQPRSAHRRAPRPARGPVPALSLPHDHELHQDLPERAQPSARDR